MGDTFALMHALQRDDANRAVIVGAGYIGLEMAEALTTRGLDVTQIEQLPEVLPTVDPELGALVHHELEQHGVTVACRTRVDAIAAAPAGSSSRLEVRTTGPNEEPLRYPADVVLVVVGVRPDSDLAAAAGAELGAKGAIAVDLQMRTNLPDVFAAGDCAVTHHRLLGDTYLPLGTTAHKQGRVAAENALGGSRAFAGCLGTQVVKLFDLVAARTCLRTTKPPPPTSIRSLSPLRPTTTSATTPAATPSPCATPATAATDDSSASSSSGTSAQRSPNASTSPRPQCSRT
jgi:NADPH-dependent 2,4-dienoyl-CoA reductase/sulfur reductase-like enzyme